MVAAAAREIRESEWVFVGMRLPMLAFNVAKRTHAPSAVGFYESGVIRDTPPAEGLRTMGDPSNLRGAAFCGPMVEVLSFLQQGRIDLGLLGAAEVDRFGNLNTLWGHRDGRAVRLPGAGGACDIACLAHRTVVLLEHQRHRLVERVAHVTSPGFGTGGAWRAQQGLPARSGPSAIVTTLGVLRFAPDGEAYLASVHPGVSVDEVLDRTGWPLRVDGAIPETPPPSEQELAVIRTADPQGLWTS